MQKFKAAVHVEMDANNPSKFISLNLNLEALLVIVFAAVVLIIGLAHSCSRPGVPAAPGRVESEPSQINERQDERINGRSDCPEAQTTELSVLPVANHAPKPKGPFVHREQNSQIFPTLSSVIFYDSKKSQ